MTQQQFEIYQPQQAPAVGIDELDRQRAEAWLRDAHARGRFDAGELYERLALVDGARDRGELNTALVGLSSPGGTGASVAARTAGGSRLTAAMGHFSVFFLWLLGPFLMSRIAPKGSYARREAAKAFNFQLVSFIVFALTDVLTGDHFDVIKAVMALVWLVLTVKGGVRAAKGEDWRNPVTRVARVRVLDEGQPRTAA